MVKFKIEEIQYTIPERLTVGQWKNIVRWDFEHKAHWPRILHEATGAPLEYLQNTEDDSLELGIVFIASIMNARKEAKIKDFNEITFGEWIDLDVYLNWGVDKHIEGILEILSPETTMADEAQWVIEKYTTWRTFTYKQYTKLFEMEGVTLTFQHDALVYMVEQAMQYKLGARGLRSIMEAVMTDAMYEIPSQTEMKSFEVDLNYAKSKFERTVFHQMKVVA